MEKKSCRIYNSLREFSLLSWHENVLSYRRKCKFLSRCCSAHIRNSKFVLVDILSRETKENARANFSLKSSLVHAELDRPINPFPFSYNQLLLVSLTNANLLFFLTKKLPLCTSAYTCIIMASHFLLLKKTAHTHTSTHKCHYYIHRNNDIIF